MLPATSAAMARRMPRCSADWLLLLEPESSIAPRAERSKSSPPISSKSFQAEPCGYHAGMTQAERKSNQERFMQDKGAVIVATNAFGMGINKPEIRFVLHYNLPGSVEAYYQEAGRAGRDGRSADCVLYHSPRDLAIQEFFVDKIGENNEQLKLDEIERLKDSATRKLQAMRQYASSRYCRRWNILNYFGQQATISGCGCDVPRQGEAARSE